MTHNDQVFDVLAKALSMQSYGTVDMSFEICRGQIVGLEGHQFEKLRFRDGQNTAAGAKVLEYIKTHTDKKKSGTITFSLKLNDGNIKEIMINRNMTERYKLSPSSDTP